MGVLKKFELEKPHTMKKKLHFIFPLFLVAISIIPSCELVGDCKTCSRVTYIDGVLVSETSAAEYCGVELAAKEAEPPVVIGNTTTRWECY